MLGLSKLSSQTYLNVKFILMKWEIYCVWQPLVSEDVMDGDDVSVLYVCEVSVYICETVYIMSLFIY